MGLWRILVSPKIGLPDSSGRQVLQTLGDFGISSVKTVRTARLFLIELPDQSASEEVQTARRIAVELLTDPVAETCAIARRGEVLREPEEGLAVEVFFKPGVMDNVAQTTGLALHDMGIEAISVRTARRYELYPIPTDRELQRVPRLLGNDCIEDVFVGTRPIEPPPAPPMYEFALRRVPLAGLDREALARLSRDGHLFLSVEEMEAIQGHFRVLGREPTDLELETFAQTWSEHCVHKTLKSPIIYRGAAMPLISGGAGRSGKRVASRHNSTEARYSNLLRDTIARATDELIAAGRGPECLSVFKDNAGIIAFDDTCAVAFKVETHNHPSAIEPYGGAATGVGGVIRDVLGCGLGAKPVASTDVFCMAPPEWPVDAVPRGVIHPKTVLRGVVSGVRDYGNCMGIPTVNGAVHFDARYLGNPLVFCGCVGLIPRDRIEKKVRPGDVIVVMGGRTGRDGIHGATFSSVELTDTHEDEFAHAVQIGCPIEEKKVLDAVLAARDYADGRGGRTCLFSAITDCGAGGLSSAVGEMAADTGGEVDLEKVPLKYAGLRYDEIWISESQERMVLAVPPENLSALLALAASESVEATAIGRFTDTGRLIVRYQSHIVGDLDVRFLHEGVPRTERLATWGHRTGGLSGGNGDTDALTGCFALGAVCRPVLDLVQMLKDRLAHPSNASKHWIVRQYDHEVQSGSVVKPLVGRRDGPSDAAVVRPRLTSDRAVAIGCGLCPERGDIDPYWMAVCAIDEALRNVVAVGGDPARTAILDNFCWPRVDNPRNLGALVRACQACYDTAKAYGLPFISGKDSLNNEFALDPADVEVVRAAARRVGAAEGGAGAVSDGRIAIPFTLLVSALSLIDDVRRCVTADLKQPAGQLYLVGQPTRWADRGSELRPPFDLDTALGTHEAVARMIHEGLVCAVHDVSDGGLLVAVAEMCIASGRSCRVHGLGDWLEEGNDVSRSPLLVGGWDDSPAAFYFDPFPAAYVVEAVNERHDEFVKLARQTPSLLLATTDLTSPGGEPMLEFETWGEPAIAAIRLKELEHAWKTPLDW
ncbi:MAG: phosphoribosylformylglycinamidine synthase [Planctomycetota bacterium]|nr:MAG: phosphoribosylformylglycinamidine synthase [Planctomycetota bacterium]